MSHAVWDGGSGAAGAACCHPEVSFNSAASILKDEVRCRETSRGGLSRLPPSAVGGEDWAMGYWELLQLLSLVQTAPRSPLGKFLRKVAVLFPLPPCQGPVNVWDSLVEAVGSAAESIVQGTGAASAASSVLWRPTLHLALIPAGRPLDRAPAAMACQQHGL